MATSIVAPEQKLVVGLGKLHPDYTIRLERPISELFPRLIVTNGDIYVGTQIRLAENYWTVKILDRLVTKAIKNIESSPKP
jgi:hypothetical protein